MSSYVDNHKAQQASDERINRFVFLHMAQVMGSKQTSLETIYEHLTFSHKALSEAMSRHRSFVTVELKNGVKKGESKASDILITLNQDGFDFFIKNVIIPD